MVSTRASDREGVRVAALALLDGPNTVVCSSDPVHSLSQSSVVTAGSSSQLSVGGGERSIAGGNTQEEIRSYHRITIEKKI